VPVAYAQPRVTSKLKAAAELVRRSLAEAMAQRDVLASPAAVRTFLRLLMAALEYEVFVVLFLDVQNRVIASEEMFRGTLTQTSVYPREVVKRALVLNAAAVILAHFVARHKMRLLCPVFLCARRSRHRRRPRTSRQCQGT